MILIDFFFLLVTEKSNGLDIRTFMPFSGKGYKLGETSQSIRSEKTQNIIPFSPKLSKPAPKPLINGVLNFSTSSSNKTETKVSTSKVPKISIANSKVFMNVDGSPVKLPLHSRNVTSSVTKWESSTTMTQKRGSSTMPSSSQGKPSTSQDTSADYGGPPKRPRVDSSQGIKNFFQNVPAIGVTGDKPAIGTPCEQRPINQSTSNIQIRKVNCPVCNAEVPEANINEHLDTCLSLKYLLN